MTTKTLADCAWCPCLKICDAHITGGIHKHEEGMDPCQVSLVESGMTAPNEGELEYGSILLNGEDWRLRKCDAGMGETEHRIFRNEKFFAQCDNREDADIVMVAMTCPTESISHTQCYKTGYAEGVSGRDAVLDKVISIINKNCFKLEGKQLKVTPLLLIKEIESLRSTKGGSP